MDNKPEVKVQIVCELCDKVFPNRVQKSNHKLLVHTVREEEIQCDFCSEQCIGLKEICRHISNKHSELFPKISADENTCTICYQKCADSEDVTKHTNEKHSLDSFYENIMQEISGKCRVCQMIFSQSEMEGTCGYSRPNKQ